MNNFWKSIISPVFRKTIQTPDGFIDLVNEYCASKKVVEQVRDFIKADTGPEDKCGFVNMVFRVDDNVFNIHFKKRPDRYFEVLISFQIILLSENFVTGDKEQDLHFIFENAKELSRRQYKKLIQHFRIKSPAEKTMRLFKSYASVYKNNPEVNK